MRGLKSLFKVVFTLTITCQVYGQSDTGRVLPVFKVVEVREEYNPYDVNEQELQNEPNHQVNEVLQKMPGINIRDYGGYGGVKTYSARGLGAQHSGVVINGVPQPLTFGGVVDLSNLPLENVASLQMGQSFNREIPQPALTYRNANMLFIEDQNNIFSSKKYSLKTQFEMGSFNHYLGALSGHYQFNDKYQIGVFGKFVSNQGNYPFQYQLGETNVSRFRENAAIQAMQFQLTQIIKINEFQKLTVDANYNQQDQDLPGAVVLYQNGNSKQTLFQQKFNYRLDYTLRKGNLLIRGLVNGSHSYTNYIDSSFLNQQGFLAQTYRHQNVHASIPIRYQLEFWQFYGAVDYRWQQLSGVNYLDSSIHRNEIPVVAGARWDKKGWFADAHLLMQWIENDGQWIQGYNPSVKLGKRWPEFALNVLYKNSLRLPTFYEQYYGKFDETSIEPERAHQMQLNFSHRDNYVFPIWPGTMFAYNVLLNGFYNIITDKIVTHPTKDLFVWAVENYGKVHTYGGSLSADFSIKSNDMSIVLDGNYTLQYAQDKTDPSSEQFNNQIPYTPHNLINAGLSLGWKGAFLNINYHYNGFRYAWKENVWNNVLQDFYTLDAAIGYRLKIKEKHQLAIKITGKNITDQQYEVIRSFPMPGAHLKIGLSYEIH